MSNQYTPTFYSSYSNESSLSAKIMSEHIVELLHPQSIIDVGCGIGTWLASFESRGIGRVFGIDGSHVQTSQLLIHPSKFRSVNLSENLNGLSKDLGRYDVALSLEVAEHLPETQSSAFVQFLTQLAPVIIFSAAIPNQGGTFHINEQWQDYWAKLFQQEGYIAVDALRSKTWNDSKVAYYYSQNTIVYVRKTYLENHPLLKTIHQNQNSSLNLVHPSKWVESHDIKRASIRIWIKSIPYVFSNALTTLMRKISS